LLLSLSTSPILFRSAAPLVYFSHLCSGLGLFVYLCSALQLPLSTFPFYNWSRTPFVYFYHFCSALQVSLFTSDICVLASSSPCLPICIWTYPLSHLPTSSSAFFSHCSSVL
jgi:hypothetical protein